MHRKCHEASVEKVGFLSSGENLGGVSCFRSSLKELVP